jgi:hypothetical protein
MIENIGNCSNICSHLYITGTDMFYKKINFKCNESNINDRYYFTFDDFVIKLLI